MPHAPSHSEDWSASQEAACKWQSHALVNTKPGCPALLQLLLATPALLQLLLATSLVQLLFINGLPRLGVSGEESGLCVDERPWFNVGSSF